MVYLDYSATSPLLPEAREAMVLAMDLIGNPSSLHTPGHLAMNRIEEAREEVAKLVNAEPEEIIFTSGGSESNNTITNIFAGQKVVVSAIEHPSLLESARERCETVILPVDSSGLVASSIASSTLEATGDVAGGTPNGFAEGKTVGESATAGPVAVALTSVMLANNEIGTINDIKKLAREAHALGALFHTDATQAIGKIPIDVKALDVDYMTISSHKIGGPVGVGALYVKKGAPFKPLIIGGHQEKGRRAGTYQTVNIAGFGAAAKYTREHNLPKIYEEQVQPLRDLLAERILKEVPYASINTPLGVGESKRCSTTDGQGVAGSKQASIGAAGGKHMALPHILNCSFEAAEGESIQLYLDAEGEIITSTGSACASGDGKPSHVIMATKNDAEVAHSSVRFSFGIDSTEEDVVKVMQYLPNIVKRLQGISTLKAGKVKQEDSYYGRKK